MVTIKHLRKKTVNLKNSKVMKIIRDQLKNPVGLRLPVILKMRITNCRYSLFIRLQKEQQIDNKESPRDLQLSRMYLTSTKECKK